MNLSPSTNKIFDIFSQVLNFISVELNRFAKQTSSSLKRDGDHVISRPKKMAFSTSPAGLVLGLPSPSPTVCTGVRTLTSQPNFLASIGYQICLAMVLCWRVTRAGSAKKTFLNSFLAPFSRIFSNLLCFVHILKYPDSPYNRRLGAHFRLIAACYEMAVPVKV